MTAHAVAPVITDRPRQPTPPGRWADHHPILLLSALGFVAWILFLVNIGSSADFTGDEVVYTQLGQHISTFNAISVFNGPFLVHPPVSFLLNALWERVTGTTTAPVLSALTGIRVLSALFSAVTAVLTGATARLLFSGATARQQKAAGLLATLLVVGNGFVLSFGRMALVEPAAIAAGAVIVLVGFRVRNRPAAQQILLLGVLIGLGTLIKQTVIFAALAPFLAAVLQHDLRRVLTAAGSVVVGALIWSVFPFWTAVNGHWTSFWAQQTFSIRRLFGLVTVSGVNLPNGSPLTQFGRTLGLYASGYLTLALAAVALLILLVRGRREFFSTAGRPDDGLSMMISYALLTFGFLGYSFLFAAGNQQFVLYAVGPSALLCVALVLRRPFHTPNTIGEALDPSGSAADREQGDVGHLIDPDSTRHGETPRHSHRSWAVVPAVLVLVIFAVGGASWIKYDAIDTDQGTDQVAAYVAENVTTCAAINASGSGPRWKVALTANPVKNFQTGPEALANNVHLFLLSPKDARYGYGNMSTSLESWITTNGHLEYQATSRSYESLQLWSVGGVPTRSQTKLCKITDPPPSSSAPAEQFMFLLATMLAAVGVAGGLLAGAAERRKRPSLLDGQALDDERGGLA